MVEYSHTDVNTKRKKRKPSPLTVKSIEKQPASEPKGRKVILLDHVNVYSGEGKVELWWTDFGRLVIRTFGHDERHHADIDAVDLVKGLQTLCRAREIGDAS